MSLVGASLPLSFFRKGIYIALAVFLPIRFGAPAMFYAEPLSDVAAAAVTTIVFVTVVPRTPPQKRGAPRQTHRKNKRNAYQKMELSQ